MSERVRSHSAGSRGARVPQVMSLQELFARDRRFVKQRDEAERMLSEPKRQPVLAPPQPQTARPQAPPASNAHGQKRSESPQEATSRREGLSPSKQHFQTLVKKTYFGYESQYPVHEDLARRQTALRPPKFLEQELDPKYTNYRGHAKCKWCSTPIPAKDLLIHQDQCTLRVLRCSFQDTETGEKCDVTCRGQELFHEHIARCGKRTKLCPNPGCGAFVSAQSTSLHLQHCTYEPLSCGTCAAVLRRCDEARHRDTCRLAMVLCPLQCGEVLRREDVPSHVENTAHMHKPIPYDALVEGGDSSKVVLAILLQRVLAASAELRARPSAPSAIAATLSGATSRSATPPAQSLAPPPEPHDHPSASRLDQLDPDTYQPVPATSSPPPPSRPSSTTFRQRHEFFQAEAHQLLQSMEAAEEAATADDLTTVVDDIERNYDRVKRLYDGVSRDGDAILAGTIPMDESCVSLDHVMEQLQRIKLTWRDVDRALYETKCKLYELVWMK